MFSKFVIVFISFFSLCGIASSAYIKIGNGISSSDGAKGSISNLDFSIYTINKFSLGASLEQGLYSNGGHYGKIKKASDFAKEADFDNLYKDIDKIKGFTSTSNAFVTLMYDFGAPRGLYFIGGVGYGARIKVKGTLKDMAYLASVVGKGKTPQELMNDPIFKNTIESLANNPSDLINLIDKIIPGNTDLTSQINTQDKIKNLLNDTAALEKFMNDSKGRFDNSSMSQLNTLSAVCDTLLTCDYGIAYTLGVGYDLQVWKALGIDFQAKSRYMAHSSPIYSLGANLILRW